MTSVLITGGSGYLGGRIANYLSEHSKYNIIIAPRGMLGTGALAGCNPIAWWSLGATTGWTLALGGVGTTVAPTPGTASDRCFLCCFLCDWGDEHFE